MQPTDFSFAQDPNTLSLAIIYGMIPAIAWVFFWLRENKERKRRNGILLSLFFGGALMVIVTLPVQEWIAKLSTDANVLNVLWAASEELLKFLLFALVVLTNSSKNIVDPIDYALYIMVTALGFAGFENALYFLGPLQQSNVTSIILSGSMRFLGTTLLHAASSSLIGISLGFAYFKSKRTTIVYGVVGVIAAVSLHSTFNYFIVQNNEANFFQVFGFLWVATIVIMILLEWLRKMGSVENRIHKEHMFFAHIEELFTYVLAHAGVSPVDGAPLADAFKAKGFAPESPEYRKLTTLISSLRALYAAYLKTEGTVAASDTKNAAMTMIPDNISAQGLGNVIGTVKAEVQKTMQNASTVEIHEIPVVKYTPTTPLKPLPSPIPKVAPVAMPVPPVITPSPVPIAAPVSKVVVTPSPVIAPLPHPPIVVPAPKPDNTPVFADDPFGQFKSAPAIPVVPTPPQKPLP